MYLRTNEDAAIQRWGSHSLLCSSSAGKQHPRAFSNAVLDRHRCINKMVAWKTSPQGIRLTGTMVPFPKSSTTIEEILASVAFQNVGPPSALPHSILQDGFHQARCRPRHTLQSQAGHRGLVDFQSSNLLLQILVTLQKCRTQSF